MTTTTQAEAATSPALAITCPTCGAATGQSCRAAVGSISKYRGGQPVRCHSDRVKAARAALPRYQPPETANDFENFPVDVRRAMQAATQAWAALYRAERRLTATMAKHYADGSFNNLFRDLGA